MDLVHVPAALGGTAAAAYVNRGRWCGPSRTSAARTRGRCTGTRRTRAGANSEAVAAGGRGAIRERSAILGGVEGVLTIQSAVPELPWDEHDAAVCESALIASLPQRLVNVRRVRQPLRTTTGEHRAAFETVQFVSDLLRARGFLSLQDSLFADTWAA